ncbi:hypothetical protein KBI23_28205 [bacterium]|nr:hypothetical protein [bacterium]
MIKSRLGQNLILCFTSAFVGGVASLSCSQLMAANSVAPVVRASEIQIVGPTGKEQITLKVAAEGPSITLLDKDDTQKVSLEITDSPASTSDDFRRAELSFCNLKNENYRTSLSSGCTGMSHLTMGQALAPGFVSIDSCQEGSSTGSMMCLGSFLRGEYFDVSQRHDKTVEVTVGSRSKRLKLSSSEAGQLLQKEDRASAVVSNAVFENSTAKAK